MIQLDRYDATRVKLARERVRGLGSVLVAYSGGVDSTLLLKLAIDELGDRAVAALASSPAYTESEQQEAREDRKSTRLNSSHRCISYAVFCLKKKKKKIDATKPTHAG